MTDISNLYDRYAAEFDRLRSRALFEERYLRCLVEGLDARAGILDLGCGTGEPIARYFANRGFAITGVDSAPAMIALCRHRFPGHTWVEADMRSLDLGRRFEAIIAWDSFFHLPHDEQRLMFAVFSGHVATGGRLLFTSGPDYGEAIGEFFGHPLYHASLSPQEYEALLADAGFSVTLHRVEDPDCGGHTVWLAFKQ
ncbi:class I SAM-dependent methyltransferase [Stappia sp. F7233]|uniref:Class I SAM-dependent methyltransferase n=1 Tax=Stappia albiluteola TaxID=2758565 RepID=A0A839AI95_9HYPH|nr:class I SAM-dependent methyltransferase [Stappia albiluteola]MBA5778786.1 class I SAM-dependent methyltransferase [Stappia albiluteola]